MKSADLAAIDRLGRAFDANGIEILDRTTCFQLLATVPIARMGVTIRALPVILPVNFALARRHHDDQPLLIVRSSRGTKLSVAAEGTVVAMEADGYEPLTHAGWSVLVQGSSRIIDDPDELAWAGTLPLRPWANPEAECYIAISTDLVSGRRFGAMD
jgi:hypothetical protein